MGRLTVLLTSPRIPAGLLGAAAWRALFEADEIVARDSSSDIATAVRAAGLDVADGALATAPELLSRAESSALVWLGGEGSGDDDLADALASTVVRRADEAAGAGGPEIEVVLGSYDPAGARLLDLVVVMDRLRRGCPWDREQTHRTLVRYLLEETYETVEAIESGDPDHLREELGDLLLQVVFHARVAEESAQQPFDIDDVAAGIVEKLVRRHPHVFAPDNAGERTTAAAVQAGWDDIKATEKSRASAMDGIPAGLPALSLADKVVGRAARVVADGEALPEEPARPAGYDDWSPEAVGEALLAVVVAAQARGLDAEQALRDRVRAEMGRVRAREQRALRGADDPLG